LEERGTLKKLSLLVLFLGISFLIACAEDNSPIVISPVDFELGAHWGDIYFDNSHYQGARVFTTVKRDLMTDEELLNLHRAVFFLYSGSSLVMENGNEIQQLPNLLTIDFGNGQGYVITNSTHHLNIYAGLASCNWEWCLRYYPEDLDNENPWFRRHRSSLSFDWSRIIGVMSPLIENVGEFIDYLAVNYYLELHWDDVNEQQRVERRKAFSNVSLNDVEVYREWASQNDLDFTIIYDRYESHEGEQEEVLDVVLLLDERQEPFEVQVFIGPRYVRVH